MINDQRMAREWWENGLRKVRERERERSENDLKMAREEPEKKATEWPGNSEKMTRERSMNDQRMAREWPGK